MSDTRKLANEDLDGPGGRGIGIPEDIPALTGVRALAAAWVVLLHFWESFLTLIPPLVCATPLIGQGNFGVDLFFLLSGLIMMHVYGDSGAFGPEEYRHFIARRLARIYPAYLAAFVFMVGLVVAADLLGVPRSTRLFPEDSLPFEALMIQTWGPLKTSWNYPAWSVSAEWFAYLFVFPVALGIYRHLENRIEKGKSGWLALALAGLFLAGLAFSPFPDGLPHALVRVTCEFLTGAMLYKLIRSVGLKTGWGSWAMAGGILILVANTWRWLPLDRTGAWWLMLIALSLVLFGLGSGDSLGSRLLGNRVMVYLGTISYSLYLVHAPVQRILKVVLPAQKFAADPAWLKVVIAAVYVTMLLVAAAALFHWVENPCRRYLTRKLAGRLQPLG